MRVPSRTFAARDAVIGLVAGITATCAMTIAMDILFKRLPQRHRYPLPPRALTERVAEIARLKHKADEDNLQAATLLSHFAFGGATGLIYGLLTHRAKLVGAGSGITYGVAVWTLSYLGWVPGLGLLKSASRHPDSRNRLMIAAHLVWGSVLGMAVRRLSQATSPFSAGPVMDRPRQRAAPR